MLIIQQIYNGQTVHVGQHRVGGNFLYGQMNMLSTSTGQAVLETDQNIGTFVWNGTGWFRINLV